MGLDTVELVFAFENSFGISFSNAEAAAMLTSREVATTIYGKVKSDLPEDRGCLGLRAFFRLRTAFVALGVPPTAVRPETKVATILPARARRDTLSALYQRAGFAPLPRLHFGLQDTSGRVRDIVGDALVRHHAALRLPGHGWSRRQVRDVVRAIIMAQVNLQRGFSDDARIVEDLGVD